MKTVEEASRIILAAFEPLGEERVSLLEALGRYASKDLRAQYPAPPFDNSAMDGYAVRAQDVTDAGPECAVRLPVQGESRAGGPPPDALVPGTAMRIFTGAPMPVGADAVVVQEDTTREADDVLIRFAAKRQHHVRTRGSDLTEGSLLVPRGGRVGSGEIALLASQDIPQLPVFRKPRVAILCTGDELREIGERDRPGSIVNSNAYGLAAQVLEAGALPLVLPAVNDRREDVARAVRTGLKADVLVLSGGVSVGEYDVVRAALESAGVMLDFWKIQMKPGKPVSFGRAGDVPVLGLPGNPVSSWVTFELFVRPGLRKMLGDPAPERARIKVTLDAPFSRKAGRTEFLRARLVPGAARAVAHLLPRQGSASLSSMAGVDALVVIPASVSEIDTEMLLEALLLRVPTGVSLFK